MSYSTKEVTDKLNISMHTLRYYEKERLLPPVTRDKNGNREYSDLNLEQLLLIRCMRATGMSISYIKKYMEICLEGYSSVTSRKEILLLQKTILEDRKKELEKNLEVVNLKLQYYQEFEKNGPSEYDSIVIKEHATLNKKLVRLLKS
ncbi:MAG: MerR family transcriptional regulator [Desulfosporosinus sp.]|nr:MerR family transcriptional regulator [Desulfosporosinus sp.]